MTPPSRRSEGKGVTFFVPGNLHNPLNGAHGHWSSAAWYRRAWRTKVQTCALVTSRTAERLERFVIDPAQPKCVSLTAYTWNVLDSHDGLRAALKPCIDGLVDAKLIDSDADAAGHQFLYTQEVRRKRRGVLITVTHRGAATEATDG